MNLKNICDKELIQKSVEVAIEGRRNFVTLLHYLREIERRRLFSALRYPSLFEYAVTYLKFSEDEAHRRISAMRLMRELPEIEDHLANGSLKLTHVCLARTLFAKEKKAGRKCSAQEKREVIGKLLNTSTRQAQKIAATINPDMKRTKDLNFDSLEDDVLREKLLRVKGLYAHIDPNMSLGELLHRMCDEKIKEPRKSPAAPRVESKAETIRQVWRREMGKCRNCGSTHALQCDHIIPKAAGGPTTLANLRLLCRNCNLRAAVEFYGREKMNDFAGPSVSHRESR